MTTRNYHDDDQKNAPYCMGKYFNGWHRFSRLVFNRYCPIQVLYNYITNASLGVCLTKFLT